MRILAIAALALALCGSAQAQAPEIKAAPPGMPAGPPPMPPVSFEGIDVRRDVRYAEPERDLANIFLPKSGPATGRPALIFVHGGGFVGGDKEQADFIGAWAARNGLVGVAIGYPLAPQHPWPAGGRDLGLAVAWLKANAAAYGVDPARIYIMGHSAGAAHVATYLGHRALQPSGRPDVAGAILVSGIFDLTTWTADEAYFGPKAQAAERSSLKGIVEAGTPVLIAYAEQDIAGFEMQAQALKAALDAAGRDSILIRFDGKNHFTELSSIGTEDHSLSDPVLAFVKRR